MKRTLIRIDENLCNGCGNCIAGCHEGALQLIDGKAVMVGDLYCDGLGACIGECPAGAIVLEEREAVPYDETAVMERLAPKGEAVILAHLKHLAAHGEHEWVRRGVAYLEKHGIAADLSKIGLSFGRGNEPHVVERRGRVSVPPYGCPGTTVRSIRPPVAVHGRECVAGTRRSSELRSFPVQLHLLNPDAGFLRGADLLLAADCTAFACGKFHSRFLRGKVLAIACPKLDGRMQAYEDKLLHMMDVSGICSLTVLVMEVPCCSGLVKMARNACEQARRKVPVHVTVLGLDGTVKSEGQLN